MSILDVITRRLRKTPNCRDVNRFLVDYVDENLSAGTRRRFEQHLNDCPECRTFVAQYSETIRFVREDEIDIPAGLAEHTLEFLRSTPLWR